MQADAYSIVPINLQMACTSATDPLVTKRGEGESSHPAASMTVCRD